MKFRTVAFSIVAAIGAVAVWSASAPTSYGVLINSWENSTEGWSIFQGAFSSGGFSTTTGVTDQTYSWAITGNAAPNYSSFMGGPQTLALTTLLGTTDKISIDVTTPTGGEFGGFMQWSAFINNSDTGFQSLDSYSYSQSPNIGSPTAKTLTWTLPAAYRNTLATSANTTQVGFLIGGGGGGTFLVDNLRTTPVPEPTAIGLAGLVAAGLAAMRRRK